MSDIQNITPGLVSVGEYKGRQVASGRELHEFLQVGRDYSTWFKQMCEYGFAEGLDFTPIRGESTGGRPSVDHALMIDMAKELGMIQRTELGRRIRQYFIEVEKRAAAPVELDRRALALMVIESEDARVAAEQRAIEGEQFRAAIESSEGLTPREFHKAYFADVQEKDFFALLYARRLLINQLGKGTKRENGTYRDGAQHGHPGFEGKQFFYLDTGVSKKTGYRFEQARVRPGQPELDLIDYLAKRGFTPTRIESKELSIV